MRNDQTHFCRSPQTRRVASQRIHGRPGEELSDSERVLNAGAQELGINLTARQRQQLLELIADLAEWNQRFNLTAIDAPLEAVRKHLLDSLSIHRYVSGSTVADVGSGAGFPGLP